MNILLHTIALEPARWTPQKVSRPLAEILPAVSAAGFYKLEVFEPHLSWLPDEAAMGPIFERLHLVPSVLSSYLDLTPSANPDEHFRAEAADLLARVDRFGFNKVRLFPGRSPSLAEVPQTLQEIAGRLRFLAEQRPGIEFLVETHDGSLADDAARMVELIEACNLPNVGLLWQPTVFEAAAALAQWEVQRAYVRHIHLQNRTAGGKFTSLESGVVPWADILARSHFGQDVTIEFVPAGICPEEEFDLTAAVQEALQEFTYIVKLES